MSSELILHRQVVQYLKIKRLLFRSDYAAGQYKASMYHRAMHKELQAGRAWPDVFIAEPRPPFHGLFLELKKEGTRILKGNGTLVSNAHIREQAACLDELMKLGYVAEFAVGFDHAKRIIDVYLTFPPDKSRSPSLPRQARRANTLDEPF